jgi:hypothetical protein
MNKPKIYCFSNVEGVRSKLLNMRSKRRPRREVDMGRVGRLDKRSSLNCSLDNATKNFAGRYVVTQYERSCGIRKGYPLRKPEVSATDIYMAWSNKGNNRRHLWKRFCEWFSSRFNNLLGVAIGVIVMAELMVIYGARG